MDPGSKDRGCAAFWNVRRPDGFNPMRMNTHPLLKKLWSDWLRPAFTAAAIVLPIKSSLADINFVPTGSMKPTILEGDVVGVNKLAYDLKVPFTSVRLAQWANPVRGDVVVCFSPEDGI